MALTDRLGTLLSYLGNIQFGPVQGGGLLPSTITVTSGDKTYDGAAYSPTVSTTGSTGSVTYVYYSAPNAGGSIIAAPTNAGSYSVIATIAADALYAEAVSPTKNFDILKANSSISITSGDKTYDGIAYSATSSHSGSSGSITYTYYSGPGGTGSVIAAPTNAGSYSVIATLAADSNYNGAVSAADDFTINKANSSITVTSGNKTYDGIAYSATSSHSGSSGSVSYTYYSGAGGTGSVIAAPTNAGSYSVIATIAADANYNGADSSPLDFTINKAGSSITVTSGDKTYDGIAYSATSSHTGSSGSITYTYYSGPGGTGSVIAAPTNAGSYSVIASLAADTNYNSAVSSADDFTINKANSSITVTSGDKDYDGLPYSPTVSTSGSSGAITYTYYDGPDGTGSVIPAPTASGNYSVIAHLAADTNYNAANSPAKNFRIGGAIAVLLMGVRHELRGGLQ